MKSHASQNMYFLAQILLRSEICIKLQLMLIKNKKDKIVIFVASD